MRVRKFLSMLLACCIIIGLVPAVSLANDVQSPEAATNYHIFTALPTEEGDVTAAALYWGAPFKVDGANVFYGMNSMKQGSGSSTHYTATNEVSQQYAISVRYAGKDDTYGDYYNVIFTQPGGTSYAVAYDSGYFSQNKLQDTGAPSGDWAYKHRMYWDADSQIFYHRPNADKTVMKGLKISSTSYKLFAETVENLKKENTAYKPARLYEACVSDNVSGSDATHTWSGQCSCGYKFDYTQKENVAIAEGYHLQTVLPTAQNPEISDHLYLGAALADKFYGMSSTISNTAATTSTDRAAQCAITVRYAGNDAAYGDFYNIIFQIPGGAAYTLAYSGGSFTQNKIQDSGEPNGGWAYKHRVYFDEEGQLFYHRPSADLTVMKGLKLSASSYKIFTETVENLKNESTSYVPVRLVAACSSDNVAGSNDTHQWSGSCTCGYKFDYQEKTEEAHSATGFHPVTELPTASDSEISGNLRLGAVDTDTFYGMSGASTQPSGGSRYFPTSGANDEMCDIVVRYGGNHETYGNYYYIIFTLPNGTAYALSYSSGYISQNKLLENGEPTDGWQDKNRMFYDQEAQVFYRVIETADETVMKGLKLSTTSHNIFTESLANLKTTNTAYVPVRLYARCTSDGAAGSNSTHHWSGVCSCGAKVDFAPHDTITEWNYIVAEGHGKMCSCGLVVEELKAHEMPDDWTTDDQTGLEYKLCESCGYRSLKDHTHDYTIEQFNDESHWKACICGQKTEAAAHSFGPWVVVTRPTTLSDSGTDERICEGCPYSETRQTTLQAEDFTASPNPPANNVPFYLGATQLQIENTPTYFFKGEWAPSKYLNMDVTMDMYAAKAMYAEETQEGYKLYFDNAGVKTYLVIADMTVSESKGVFVQPVADASKASVFQWNNQYATFQTNVAGKGDYYIGLYTDDKGTAYTKLQALLVSGLGRDDRHPSQIYMNTKAADHEHSFGDWVLLSTPKHLQEQGKEERICTICSYVEIRVTTLSPDEFVASANPPATDVPFYLGATQRQITNRPTYFFNGAWAPSKYINMDVSTQKEGAVAMYSEAVNGGYKLYFYNEGVKTYLRIAEMTVSQTQGVFVQPVTSAGKASVFLWNQQYSTFYTNVPGRGDYYIGLYTDDSGTAYTKLQALLVSGLGRNDRHPAKIYLRTYADHKHAFGSWVSKSYPTHLNDQGVQERACTGCDYVQARVVMLSPSNYKPATSAPRSGSTFYLGATQLQIEDHPAHFFLGEWLPRKLQRMDVTADLKKAALIYSQSADGGYKLYFYNEGVKTYLTIADMTVEGDRGVFVQPVTDESKAAVFIWNQEYCTFQTNVPGKGNYCIGNYTVDDIKYTKLSALPVSDLSSENFHPAVPYVLR